MSRFTEAAELFRAARMLAKDRAARMLAKGRAARMRAKGRRDPDDELIPVIAALHDEAMRLMTPVEPAKPSQDDPIKASFAKFLDRTRFPHLTLQLVLRQIGVTNSEYGIELAKRLLHENGYTIAVRVHDDTGLSDAWVRNLSHGRTA